MIELAREIHDCIYISGIILNGWVYFYTTSSLTHCGTLTHSCQNSQTGCCGVLCCDGTGTPEGQRTRSIASCYLPEQSSMNYSFLVVFASPVLFTPTNVPRSLCIPTAGLSPDPKFFLLSVLAFFLEYCCRRYGSLCGSVKCLLHRAEKAEGSVQPFSCYTTLSSTRHDFA